MAIRPLSKMLQVTKQLEKALKNPKEIFNQESITYINYLQISWEHLVIFRYFISQTTLVFRKLLKKKSPAEQKSEARTRKTQRLRAESMSRKTVNSGCQDNEERRQQLSGMLQKRPAEKRNQSKLNKTNFSYHLEQHQGTPDYRLNLTQCLQNISLNKVLLVHHHVCFLLDYNSITYYFSIISKL